VKLLKLRLFKFIFV